MRRRSFLSSLFVLIIILTFVYCLIVFISLYQVRAHSDSVRRWRECENYWKLKSEHSPHVVNTFMADDTEAWRAPHFTNRPIKAVATKYRSVVGHTQWEADQYHRFPVHDVVFLYGPVGHTHNGIDAKHNIHLPALLSSESDDSESDEMPTLRTATPSEEDEDSDVPGIPELVSESDSESD